jgi:hypothetical protein
MSKLFHYLQYSTSLCNVESDFIYLFIRRHEISSLLFNGRVAYKARRGPLREPSEPNWSGDTFISLRLPSAVCGTESGQKLPALSAQFGLCDVCLRLLPAADYQHRPSFEKGRCSPGGPAIIRTITDSPPADSPPLARNSFSPRCEGTFDRLLNQVPAFQRTP